MKPNKFKGNKFKAYHGWIVEVYLTCLIYIIGTASIILLFGIQKRLLNLWFCIISLR